MSAYGANAAEMKPDSDPIFEDCLPGEVKLSADGKTFYVKESDWRRFLALTWEASGFGSADDFIKQHTH